MVVSPNLGQRRPPSVPSIEVLSPWVAAWPGLVEVMSPANDHCDETPLLNVSTPSSDAGEDNIERSNEYLYLKHFQMNVMCPTSPLLQTQPRQTMLLLSALNMRQAPSIIRNMIIRYKS